MRSWGCHWGILQLFRPQVFCGFSISGAEPDRDAYFQIRMPFRSSVLVGDCDRGVSLSIMPPALLDGFLTEGLRLLCYLPRQGLRACQIGLKPSDFGIL